MTKSEQQDIEDAIQEILRDSGKGEGADPAAAEQAAEADAAGIEPEQGAEPQPEPVQPGSAEAEELVALRAERDDLRDRFVRAIADAENARKRSDRDRKEAEQYGGSKLSRDLLPVYDNLKRALDSVTDEQRAAASALLEGVELTMRELVSIFAKHGIEKISPETGEKFDPNMHQAMFEAPVPGTNAGEIIQVMADGFMLHDRLLRPAHVGVSSTPAS
ncbi:nucleotide exchange factor GrpE [Mesobaculum littorinae]|uniref:Protein GrpE n=1 Tax=Mesobaculum littorinae TaxID=2486419 RepID=A0A438AHF9_9RHOB|nr:nucleotide exchange factor GrpE [Mesobaculum littorinae]RVV98027.1 nucleotide exchange factor GrpE [Mesobaculum littorinae]